MLAVQQDMIGMFTTGHPPRVLPAYGAEYRLGTNPIAVAAPTRNEPPFLFDVATSATAAGMVRLATRYNLPIRPGWVADADGAPIMQETQAPEEGDYRLLPFGGTLEGGTHKGYGFGLVAEILSTMLGGALPAMVTGGDGFNHYMAAYNIASFTNVETFKDNMDRMLRTLRETKPAPGPRASRLPGSWRLRSGAVSAGQRDSPYTRGYSRSSKTSVKSCLSLHSRSCEVRWDRF